MEHQRLLEIHVNKVQSYCNLRQEKHGFLFLLCHSTFYFCLMVLLVKQVSGLCAVYPGLLVVEREAWYVECF